MIDTGGENVTDKTCGNCGNYQRGTKLCSLSPKEKHEPDSPASRKEYCNWKERATDVLELELQDAQPDV